MSLHCFSRNSAGDALSYQTEEYGSIVDMVKNLMEKILQGDKIDRYLTNGLRASKPGNLFKNWKASKWF